MDRNIDVCLYDWELWVCCIVYEVCAKNSERRVYLKDCHKEPLSKAAKGCRRQYTFVSILTAAGSN